MDLFSTFFKKGPRWRRVEQFLMCGLPGKWLNNRGGWEVTGELWADVEKCSRIGILGTTDCSGKWGYRLTIEEIGGEPEYQGLWKANMDDVSRGWKMPLVCRASIKGKRQQGKVVWTTHGNGEPGTRKTECERWNESWNSKCWKRWLEYNTERLEDSWVRWNIVKRRRMKNYSTECEKWIPEYITGILKYNTWAIGI